MVCLKHILSTKNKPNEDVNITVNDENSYYSLSRIMSFTSWFIKLGHNR